jgi:YD repeat-containing protein
MGSEIFYFSTAGSASGRHLRTRDALTGAIRYTFGYDADGRLVTIRDVSGLTTTIDRA